MSRAVFDLGKLRRLLSLPPEKLFDVLQAAATKALKDYRSSEVNLGDLVHDVMEYPG